MSERRFTVEEANALLPTLAPELERLRDAQAVFAEHAGDLHERAVMNGGGAPSREYLDAVGVANHAIAAVRRAGVVIRDPASGLIDFPAERDGETVFLCWRVGEERVSWWHPTTSGFADRRPL